LKYVDSDLPEVKFLNDIKIKDKKMSELSIEKEEFSAAIGILKKNNLIDISKVDNEMKFSAKAGVQVFFRKIVRISLVYFLMA